MWWRPDSPITIPLDSSYKKKSYNYFLRAGIGCQLCQVIHAGTWNKNKWVDIIRCVGYIRTTSGYSGHKLRTTTFLPLAVTSHLKYCGSPLKIEFY